jgi:hypothetical protein
MDNIELILGILSILFLMSAIFISILAFKNLPTGYLSGYIKIIIYSAIMLTLGYIWHTIREFYDLKEELGTYMEYPEYIFQIVYAVFLAYASYRLYVFSKEFKAENKKKSRKK